MMLSFYFKKIGYGIAALSLVMFLLIMLNYTFFSAFTEAWVGGLQWFGLCGLILVTVSREKNETAEVETLRNRCFFQTFFKAFLIMVVFSLSNLLVTDDAVSVDKALTYLKDNDLFKFSVIFLTVHFFVFRSELKKMSKIS
jgi:hypothetical protein